MNGRLGFLALVLMFQVGCHSGAPVASVAPVKSGGEYNSGAARVTYPESRAWANYIGARMKMAEGDMKSAVEYLNRARLADPSSMILGRELATAYAHSGNIEAAEREVRELLTQEPDAPELLLQLGEYLYRQERWADAIRVLEQTISLKPDLEGAYLRLVASRERLGQLESALDTVEQLLEIHPESRAGRLLLGQLQISLEHPDEAELIYRDLIAEEPGFQPAIVGLVDALRAQGKEKAAIDILREALVGQESGGNLRIQLIRILIQQENWEEALNEMLSFDSSQTENITMLRRMGLVLIELERWSDAATVWEKLAGSNPPDPSAFYYLGLTFERQEKWEEASSAFSKIDPDDESYPDSLHHLAYVTHKLGLTQQAIQYMQQRIALAPDRPDLFDFLAALNDSDQNNQAAMDVLKSGLSYFPDDSELLYHLGMLKERTGQSDQALALMRQVLESDPAHVDAMNYIAYYYAERNVNLDEALTLIQKALEGERRPYMLDTLGWVQYRLGRYDDARVALEEASRGLDEDAVIFEHLGYVYSALGLRKEAIDAFERSLLISPDNQSIQLKLRWLKDDSQ